MYIHILVHDWMIENNSERASEPQTRYFPSLWSEPARCWVNGKRMLQVARERRLTVCWHKQRQESETDGSLIPSFLHDHQSLPLRRLCPDVSCQWTSQLRVFYHYSEPDCADECGGVCRISAELSRRLTNIMIVSRDHATSTSYFDLMWRMIIPPKCVSSSRHVVPENHVFHEKIRRRLRTSRKLTHIYIGTSLKCGLETANINGRWATSHVFKKSGVS